MNLTADLFNKISRDNIANRILKSMTYGSKWTHISLDPLDLGYCRDETMTIDEAIEYLTGNGFVVTRSFEGNYEEELVMCENEFWVSWEEQ